MRTKILEAGVAKDDPRTWGRFLLGRMDVEWEAPSAIDDAARRVLGADWQNPERATTVLSQCHYSKRGHLLVLDLSTGEGAVFNLDGWPNTELQSHKIRVSPMFQPLLDWLSYRLYLEDLDALPAFVRLHVDPNELVRREHAILALEPVDRVARRLAVSLSRAPKRSGWKRPADIAVVLRALASDISVQDAFVPHGDTPAPMGDWLQAVAAEFESDPYELERILGPRILGPPPTAGDSSATVVEAVMMVVSGGAGSMLGHYLISGTGSIASFLKRRKGRLRPTASQTVAAARAAINKYFDEALPKDVEEREMALLADNWTVTFRVGQRDYTASGKYDDSPIEVGWRSVN